MAAGLALAIPASAEAKLRFRPCDEAVCGVLSVPLDHSGAVPGRLSLRVKRYPSFDPGPHGVVLVLAGAPGEAAFETENLLLETPGHDLVRFDQRGTGSGALRCRDLEAATPTDAGREAAACATLLGDRRAFFRTTDTVEDIEALRAELGCGAAHDRRAGLRRLRGPALRDALSGPRGAAAARDAGGRRRPRPAVRRLDGGGSQGAHRATSWQTPPVSWSGWLREPLEGQIVGPTGHRRTAFLTRQELLYILTSGGRPVSVAVRVPGSGGVRAPWGRGTDPAHEAACGGAAAGAPARCRQPRHQRRHTL